MTRITRRKAMLTALAVAITGIFVSNLSIVGGTGKASGEGSSILSHALFIIGALAAMTFLVLVALTVVGSIRERKEPGPTVQAPDRQAVR